MSSRLCQIYLALTLAVASCTVTPTPNASTPTPPTTAVPESPLPPIVTATVTTSSTVAVWMPPEFAPDDGVPGGSVLAEQLAEFEQTHPNTQIKVRMKEASGPGGLLQSLITAHNVAPKVLPNLIALNGDDLATAAAMGLVLPLDDVIPAATFDDYYPFAQAMGRVANAYVGLPFAADARVLVYSTQAFSTPPLTWADVYTGPLIIPGGEPTGLTLLNEYLALGGPLTSESGAIELDPEVLAEALGFFQAVQDAGHLSLSTLAYTDPAATWQVFRERRALLAVTSLRWYLAERTRVNAAAVTLLPVKDGTSFALAEGWCWALVNTAPEQQDQAVALLAWLTDPEPLARWTQAAQVLPPRAAAFARWPSTAVAASVGDVLIHAELQPPAAVLARVGPPLRQALDDVLSGRATPFAAATIAVQLVAQGQ